MTVTKTKHREESADYYDRIYASASRTGVYDVARFSNIYDAVLDYLPEPASILEVGCGVGELGRRLVITGHRYTGFDFSSTALEKHSLCTMEHVWRGNAYDMNNWLHFPYNALVAVEVFEHLDDLYILRFVPPGTHVVFSVPNFNSRSHLRTYPDDESIHDYYKDVLDIRSIRKLDTKKDKAIFVCDAVRR